MKVEILGIRIDQIDLAGALDFIREKIQAGEQAQIATVNPEFIVAAQTDNEFKNILNNCPLATCDGIGLVWAGKFLHGKSLARATGVDLTEKILTSGYKVFLLGGSEGSAQGVKDKFPQAQIVGAETGGKLRYDNVWILDDNEAVLERINESGAEILLVALPQVKQEKWIAQNLPKLATVKIAIGVGGTFDFLSGKIKRAPRWVRGLGLEWLFRLIKEPQRWKRIWNATGVFAWLVVKRKIQKTKI
jgi:N-acetylglucosaminyldiphosphoundecaprenol N-acetyl-beta-D-mannosaminyltransferase